MYSSEGKGGEGSLESEPFGENDVEIVVRSCGESLNFSEGLVDVTELFLPHSVVEAEPGLSTEGCAVVGSFHLAEVPVEVRHHGPHSL